MSEPAEGGAAPAASAPNSAPSIDRMIDAILKSPSTGEKPLAGTEEPAEASTAPADASGNAEPEQAEEPAVEAPKPKPAENARLAKALVDLEREQASKLKLERRLKDLETKLSEAAADPAKALALGKHDPESFIAAMLDGKVKKPDEPKLSPEQQALEELKTQLAALQQERDDARAKETYLSEISVIKDRIKDRELAGLYPWAPDRIYTDFYQEYERTGEVPDLDDVIEKFEAGIAGELALPLSSERALQKLLSDPKKREMVVKALGLSRPTTETSKPAQRDTQRASEPVEGPSVITSKMAAEVPERRAKDIRPRAERNERTFDILLSKGKHK